MSSQPRSPTKLATRPAQIRPQKALSLPWAPKAARAVQTSEKTTPAR
jgi:hypothetical protein